MKVDIDRIQSRIEAIAKFTATPGKGATRLSYSPEYRQACDFLLTESGKIGLQGRLDAIGNIRFRLEGRNPDAPTVLVASHVDTVIQGGNFDGVLGVVLGLEILDILIRNDVRPENSIELISFVEEEGVSFGCPTLGSKALCGEFRIEDLRNLRAENGESVFDRASAFGLEPEKLSADQFQPKSLKAMLEVHIEQSPLLEAEGIPVGIVETVAGSEVHRIQLDGVANHAGTTPMDHRHDALIAAAEIILVTEQEAAQSGRPTTVATVGCIHCEPNATNVIPGRVDLTLDVRDVKQADIETTVTKIMEGAGAVATTRGVKLNGQRSGSSPPRPLSDAISKNIASIADDMGIAYRWMNGGALHDAATMAGITDVGLLFVPSRAGLSHTPEEWTNYADIEPGANLLLATVCDLAEVDCS